MIDSSNKSYKPTKAAKFLLGYGHNITPNGIRKWDHILYSSLYKRADGDVRFYTDKDLKYFNLILIMRKLGFTVQEIKDLVKDIHKNQGDSPVHAQEINRRLQRLEQGVAVVRELLHIPKPV